MKFNLMKEEITTMLTGLTEQFESMDSHQGRIPQIEMDIFMRNIQKLYEDTTYLKKLNENIIGISAVEEESLIEEKKVEEVINEIEFSQKEVVLASVVEESIVVDQKVEEMEAVPIIADLKSEVMEQVSVSEIVDEPKKVIAETESSLDEIVAQPNLENNLFSQVKASPEISDLNKKLADARNTHSIVEKLQNHRIENLKSVIGINDKFYFINELFGGNAQKYEDIIYTLNNFKKLDDAMQYFSTLKYRFNWNEESEPFEKLVNMLERKFNLIDA